MEHRNGLRSRGSELRTILVRLVSRRAGSEAGMEKAYHVTTGSHEAMAGTGISVKHCCLRSLENTEANPQKRVECTEKTTFSHLCNQEAPSLFSFVGGSFIHLSFQEICIHSQLGAKPCAKGQGDTVK